MLAEFLSEQGEWAQVMPGARACLFSLCERSFPLPLRLEPLHFEVLRLEPLHFEVLFCLAGMLTLTRRDGSALRLGTRQVLLLTDISDLTDARVETGLKGVLVAVDARGARESLKAICDLLGGLNQVRRWMVSRGGCAVEGPSHWSQAAFADLDRLPQSERARWCVWKSVELLYLLSAPEEPAAEMAPVLDQEMIRTLAETCRYMEEHLDEPLSTLQLHSRRGSVVCTDCRSTPGCSSGGWSVQRSCCGTPPSACWGWPSPWDTAVPASSPPPSGGSMACRQLCIEKCLNRHNIV